VALLKTAATASDVVSDLPAGQVDKAAFTLCALMHLHRVATSGRVRRRCRPVERPARPPAGRLGTVTLLRAFGHADPVAWKEGRFGARGQRFGRCGSTPVVRPLWFDFAERHVRAADRDHRSVAVAIAPPM
jgi:hypothetical protein